MSEKRLTPVSWTDFVRRLKELGFEGPFPSGKHPKMKRGNRALIIPNPHVGTIGVGFLKRLIRQAGLTVEEWTGTTTGR